MTAKPDLRIAAVLLAAGESRRMGACNKLALQVDGIPLVRRTARVLLDSKVCEVVAVLGHEAERVRGLLTGLPLRVVINEEYAEGQMNSVHCGLAALDDVYDGVMIALSDQPLIEAEDIDRIVAGFAQCERGSVLVPVHAGQRGNPIVLPWEHRERILAGERNLGCKRLIERNPELVTTLEFEHARVTVDLDTTADYARLQLHVAERRGAVGLNARSTGA